MAQRPAKKRAAEKEEAPARPAEGAESSATPWIRPPGLSLRGWLAVLVVVLVVNIPIIHRLLRGAPEITVHVPYTQTFESPAVVDRDFWTTGGLWRVVGQELFGPGVKKNPLWLKASLPAEAAVEFDVRATEEGDVRAVVFGNGVDQGSGYLLIQGGENGKRSSLSRLNGPSATLPAGSPVRLEAKVPHHWRIERRGNRIAWLVDGQPYLSLEDPDPLAGKGHDRFGFTGLESDIWFDNLWVGPVEAVSPFPYATGAPAPPPLPTLPPGPSADSFDRAELGPDWLVTGPGNASIENGALTVQMGHNRPVWLRRPMPDDATIEFDTWTDDPKGDIKFEAWGDGSSAYSGDLRQQYTATGYVFIFGGWGNTETVIARQQEHSPGRAQRGDLRVVPGHRYHMRIERQGAMIQWLIDGAPAFRMTDPQPLSGEGHRHFAFSGWETKVHFDNLRVSGP
jgi:hypothetical protein